MNASARSVPAFSLAAVAASVASAALAAALGGTPAASHAQAAVAAAAATAACPALLNQSFPRLQDEKPQQLCQYAGKVVLVVNTASYCGYTPQYQGLESLYSKYAGKGLVVLGFPSNDFTQESNDKDKIADLCFNTYGVKFPMFSSSTVKGKDANPLFAQLAKDTGKQPAWNFNKYLIDRDGKAVAYYGSKTAPDSAELVGAIEKALSAR
jgi:glutathione peroxidase